MLRWTVQKKHAPSAVSTNSDKYFCRWQHAKRYSLPRWKASAVHDWRQSPAPQRRVGGVSWTRTRPCVSAAVAVSWSASVAPWHSDWISPRPKPTLTEPLTHDRTSLTNTPTTICHTDRSVYRHENTLNQSALRREHICHSVVTGSSRSANLTLSPNSNPPKFNQLFSGLLSTYSQNFTEIHPQLSELSR